MILYEVVICFLFCMLGKLKRGRTDFRYHSPQNRGAYGISKPIEPLNLNNPDAIVFSNLQPTTKNNKNCVVLFHGMPVKNQVFYAKAFDKSTASDISIPFLKTDNDGVLYLLTRPSLDHQYDKYDYTRYQPIKLSKRLGFVVKDLSHKTQKKLIYKSNFLGKYINLGIDPDLLRQLITQNSYNSDGFNITQTNLYQNWVNAFSAPEHIQKQYRRYNHFIERTQHSNQITNKSLYGLMAVSSVGLITTATIATFGLLPSISLGISAGLFSLGAGFESVGNHLNNRRLGINKPQEKKLPEGSVKIDEDLRSMTTESSEDEQKLQKTENKDDSVQSVIEKKPE